MRSKASDRSTASYILGFLLALVFTIIPYYLVVNQWVTGTPLLVTILVFAFLQMFIQIFFFLHLGRGPKPLYNAVFFIATFSLILVVVGGSIFIIHNLHYNMAPPQTAKQIAETEGIAQVGGQKTGACQEIHTNHQVVISNGKLSVTNTKAALCDTLTFINKDPTVHVITFGVFPQQTAYSGNVELSVHKGYSQIITLNQSGSYQFYDQLNPKIAGYFTVTP